MAMYPFAAGTLFGFRTDQTVNQAHKFGTLQEVEVDFDASVKELFGQYQFPVDTARGSAKITGKAKIAGVQGLLFADLFFNVSTAAGQVATSQSASTGLPETQTVTAGVANPTFKTTFSQDLGVIYNATGVPLQRVAGGAEVAGQSYSIDGSNVYHFNTGDNGLVVQLNYNYTIAGTGQKFVITNQLLGTAPTFGITMEQISKTKKTTLTLNACISNKLTVPTKLEDYTIYEFDFSAFADSSGNIGTWSVNEID
jgi:hypothetical protein